MVVAVSPYHLTTREAPALVALALAERVATMLPVPPHMMDASGPRAGGLGGWSALQTAARIPTYKRFVESWAWTTPLWKQGVLGFGQGDRTCAEEMWGAVQHIEDEPACAPLRHFLRHHDYPDASTYLAAVAADLLKGGPDPGISLPVAIGLDRFATRYGLAVARSRATSLAQQAESRLGTTLTTLALPVLLQATSERILHYREVLEPELRGLRGAIQRVVGVSDGSGPGNADASDARMLQDAGEALARAFESRRGELFMGAIDDDVRALEGTVAITLTKLPWDAAITSSVRAMDSLHPVMAGTGRATASAGSATSPPGPAAPDEKGIVPHDGLQGREFVAMVVRTMGR